MCRQLTDIYTYTRVYSDIIYKFKLYTLFAYKWLIAVLLHIPGAGRECNVMHVQSVPNRVQQCCCMKYTEYIGKRVAFNKTWSGIPTHAYIGSIYSFPTYVFSLFVCAIVSLCAFVHRQCAAHIFPHCFRYISFLIAIKPTTYETKSI